MLPEHSGRRAAIRCARGDSTHAVVERHPIGKRNRLVDGRQAATNAVRPPR
jgi:hypothetical protein